MSIDAIAILQPNMNLDGEFSEEGWIIGEGPGGASGPWRPLSDGVLLNLGLSIRAPDIDLYEAAGRWIGTLPERIWVFPDTEVPEEETTKAMQLATREVGRWVNDGVRRQSLLTELGFSPDEEGAWQREMNSGNSKRIQAAVTALEERLHGRDPKQVEAVLARMLRRG
jgi:hypothetical protein